MIPLPSHGGMLYVVCNKQQTALLMCLCLCLLFVVPVVVLLVGCVVVVLWSLIGIGWRVVGSLVQEVACWSDRTFK